MLLLFHGVGSQLGEQVLINLDAITRVSQDQAGTLVALQDGSGQVVAETLIQVIEWLGAHSCLGVVAPD